MDYFRNVDKLSGQVGPSVNLISDIDISTDDDVYDIVSVEEFKAYARIEGWTESPATEFEFDDVLIADLITSCRKHLEKLCNVSLVPHEISALITNGFGIYLPFSPIDEVTEILDDQGNSIDLSGTNFKLIGVSEKILKLPLGCDMKVTYSTLALNDERAAIDIKRMVYYLYENRGDTPDKAAEQLSLVLSYSRKSPVA